MNGSHRPKMPPRARPFSNHLTVLLLVLVLALMGCQGSVPLSTRIGQPHLGNKFVTYTFRLPGVAKIKARNPDENFSLTHVVFSATSERQGCADEQQTIPYAADTETIAIDLRPGCNYKVKIDGVGLKLSGPLPTDPDDGQDGQPEDPPASALITYQQVIAPLMQKHCVSCHVAQGPMQAYPLSTMDQVKARIDSIIERVELENMPPRGPFFSDNQIGQLKAWRSGGFALSQGLKLSDQSEALLCTSREFKFRAGLVGGEAITPDFVWYFEQGF